KPIFAPPRAKISKRRNAEPQNDQRRERAHAAAAVLHLDRLSCHANDSPGYGFLPRIGNGARRLHDSTWGGIAARRNGASTRWVAASRSIGLQLRSAHSLRIESD